MTDELTIREITSKDPPTIAKAFRAQGWNKTRDQYEKYLLQQMEGRRTVLIAELNGEFVDHCGLQPCHVFHKEAQGVKGQSFTLLAYVDENEQTNNPGLLLMIRVRKDHEEKTM